MKMFIAICGNSSKKTIHIIATSFNGYLNSFTITSYFLIGPFRHKKLSKKLILKYLRQKGLDYDMKIFLFSDTITCEEIYKKYDVFEAKKIYSISYD